MTKTLTISAAALMLALPALAQDAQRPATPQQAPQMQQPQHTSPQTSPRGTTTQGGMQYIERQQAGQWLASHFMDRTVYGRDGESIGDVNDVLVDRSGQIVAVVIGVGGFLGIGEKNVAVPFSRLEMQPAAARGAGTTATAPAGQTTAMGGDLWHDRNARLVLSATREELRNAPTFAEMDERSARTNTDGRTNERAPSTTPMAPAPAPAPAR